jgi:hypothetical protein
MVSKKGIEIDHRNFVLHSLRSKDELHCTGHLLVGKEMQ